MELTIDQAIQQGVAAHKEGKLEEAEKLYRAILGAQPSHADANHNLGVLAVSVGKVQEALPHFKTALDTNAKVEQYWLSYIDAFVKLCRLDDGRQVLQQAKEGGFSGEKFNQLEGQLTTTVTSAPSSANPTKAEIDGLIALYTQGKLDEALAKGNALSHQFPNNPVIPNVLGVIHFALDNYEEAIRSYNRAIRLSPNWADAHNNLGNALSKLEKYDEAIKSYNKAIEFKPNYAEAYYNLGSAQDELLKYDDAIISYNRAIELKPDYAEAYNNLGLVLYLVGRIHDSAGYLEKAISLQQNYADARYNLANTYKELGRLDEAELNHRKAIQLKPDFSEGHYNLGLLLHGGSKFRQALEHFECSDFKNSKYYLLRCLYYTDDRVRFMELLDQFIEQGVVDPMIGSLVCRSALKYDTERQNLFCADPLEYVVQTNLSSQYDFESVFIKTARAILDEKRS